MRLRTFSRVDAVVSGEMEYVIDGDRYTHRFRSRLLSEEELDEDLAGAGLRRLRFLDEHGAWLDARPIALR
jgi:hypothetical protein